MSSYAHIPANGWGKIDYPSLEGAEINQAKEILAYEVTKLVHGEEKAKKALEDARAVFASGGTNAATMPTVELDKASFEARLRTS